MSPCIPVAASPCLSSPTLRHVSNGHEPTVSAAVEGSVWPEPDTRVKAVIHGAGARQLLPDRLSGAEVDRGPVVHVQPEGMFRVHLAHVQFPGDGVNQPGPGGQSGSGVLGNLLVNPYLCAASAIRVDIDA